MDDSEHTLNFNSLPISWDAKAESEISENKEKAIKCLNEMKKRIEDDGGFHCSTSCEYLLRFLRVAKYDVDKAVQKLKKRLLIRIDYPEVFITKSLSEIFHGMSQDFVVVLPEKTDDGAVVILFQSDLWNIETCPADDWFKTVLAIIEYTATTEPMTQNSLAARYRQIHVINENAFFDIFYAICRPLLSKKIKDRVHIHGNSLSNLHKYVPASILPEELGGEKGSSDCGRPFWNNIKENEKLLVDLCNYYYKAPEKDG